MKKTATILVLLAICAILIAPFASANEQKEKKIEKAVEDALKRSMDMSIRDASMARITHIGGTLTDDNPINVGGVEYKEEAYEIKLGNGLYDNNGYIIYRRDGVKPLVNVFLFPGDSITGKYAFAYPFQSSFAREIIDGTVKNENLSFINRISKMTGGRVAVVVVDKVRTSYVPAGLPDYSFTSDWDLEMYNGDFREIVRDAIIKTGTPVHMAMGHSRGGEVIQLYGDDPIGIYVATVPLDSVGEYEPQSEGYLNSIATLKALNNYTAMGNYVADVSGLFDVLDLAQYYPDDPTPIPDFAGLTNMQVALYMLENIGTLPGPLTQETGLADSWYIKKYCAGDLGGLYYTDINRIFEIRNAGGFYPILPLAVEKQGLEKRTHGGIDGTGLKVDFKHWDNLYASINAIEGFGPDPYTEEILPKNKMFSMVPGGHLDILWNI